MEIWTIYDHPRDFPNEYVARKFIGDKPTGAILCSHDLSMLRKHFHELGLFRIGRNPQDDAGIVESWL